MKLQNEIINEYKKKFPNDKLKDISARTGLNITRIFRIFNGATLKINEYEIFCQVINQIKKTNQEPEQHYQNLNVISQAMEKLPPKILQQTINQLSYYLTIQQLKELK
ncbi:hypothetical protein N9N67_10120 [Bacteriovoracaceae bacterium]|nr:hypothetical protein [Bacteriovoracaceae bacterium]